MWRGFVSLDQFSGSREGDRDDPDFRFPLYGGRFLSYQEYVGEAREDILNREAMLMERKEELEPSTSASARLRSPIKLFSPATIVAKHY
ncbi:hypothetical protein ACH5RR_023414 [Cinchona calisaya]|uniref:Uncharacterized protein n=1 Tax=Cinchona calisaya TaxID=153742 RepID=A0ABD2ZEI3_9GENT